MLCYNWFFTYMAHKYAAQRKWFIWDPTKARMSCGLRTRNSGCWQWPVADSTLPPNWRYVVSSRVLGYPVLVSMTMSSIWCHVQPFSFFERLASRNHPFDPWVNYFPELSNSFWWYPYSYWLVQLVAKRFFPQWKITYLFVLSLFYLLQPWGLAT